MKTKVKVINEKYIVNSESKVVVCILTCNVPVDRINNDFGIYTYPWKKQLPKVKGLATFHVKGIAKCDSSDSFDEVLGKRIAQSRAKEKSYRIAAIIWSKMANYLLNIANQCFRLSNNCILEYNKEKEHIKELTK